MPTSSSGQLQFRPMGGPKARIGRLVLTVLAAVFVIAEALAALMRVETAAPRADIERR